MAGRVFVGQVQDAVRAEPARRYGEIIPLFSERHRGPINVDEITVRAAAQLVSDFDDEDFIMCVGHPVLYPLLCFYAAEANNGIVNLLVWHHPKDREPHYLRKRIDFFGALPANGR